MQAIGPLKIHGQRVFLDRVALPDLRVQIPTLPVEEDGILDYFQHLEVAFELSDEAPAWLDHDLAATDGSYLYFGDDTVFLLSPHGDDLVATACCVRGSISDEERKRRKAERKAEKAKRRNSKRQYQGAAHFSLPESQRRAARGPDNVTW